MILAQPGYIRASQVAPVDELQAFADYEGQFFQGSGNHLLDVLANDVYSGIPTIKIIAQPTIGTARVVDVSGYPYVEIGSTSVGDGRLVYELTSSTGGEPSIAEAFWSIISGASTYDGLIENISFNSSMVVWIKGTSLTDSKGLLQNGAIN